MNLGEAWDLPDLNNVINNGTVMVVFAWRPREIHRPRGEAAQQWSARRIGYSWKERKREMLGQIFLE